MSHPEGFHERAPGRRRVTASAWNTLPSANPKIIATMYRVLKGPARERMKLTFLGQRYGASPETVMRAYLQQSMQRVVR